MTGDNDNDNNNNDNNNYMVYYTSLAADILALAACTHSV